MTEIEAHIRELVIGIQRRNGGQHAALTNDLLLLDPNLDFDSLDLAEVVAGVERKFQVSLFEDDNGITTWGDLICAAEEKILSDRRNGG